MSTIETANFKFRFSAQPSSHVIGFVVGCSLLVSLLMFIIMHTFLVLRGITTLEAGDDGPPPYSFGAARNWELVFGKDPRFWFLPFQTHDVVLATVGGTCFEGYIGDPAYCARLQIQLVRIETNRQRRMLDDEIVQSMAADDMNESESPNDDDESVSLISANSDS
jgi:hypothetical protein